LRPQSAEAAVSRDAIALRPVSVSAGPPADSAALPVGERLNAVFGGRLTLLGYDIERRILNLENQIPMALLWRAAAAGQRDVIIELILANEKTGARLPPLRHRLVDGDYPLDRWEAGQVVRDRFWLIHYADIPRAVYNMSVAVLDAGTGDRLPLPDGTTEVLLGKVFMRGLK